MLSGTIRPPSLTSVVADSVREAILAGHLPCGTHLNEAELCKTLKVARNTLREALHKLQEEGLIEFERFRGCSVARLSKKRAKEIYTLRALLEPYAVQTAVQNKAYTLEDLQEFERIILQLGELEREGDLAAVVRADMELHMLICKRSDHELLVKALEGLQSQTRLFILTTKIYRSDTMLDETSHLQVLEAIRSGDPARAEDTMRRHLINAGTLLVNKMAENGK